MKLLHPSLQEAELGLRAMKMVAAASGEISLPALNLLQAAQRQILRTHFDLATLPTIAPAELAAGFSDPALRRQFVQGMIVMSLTDGVPSEQQAKQVEEFATALQISLPELWDLKLLAEQQMLLFRLDFMRRSHIRDMVQDQFQQHGLLESIRAILGLRGFAEEPALAAKYHTLEHFPQNTLGYSLWQHYHDNGFAFPGEKYGFPESGVYHDLSHILAGYSTQPEGEVQVAGFVAGYREHNPFYVILFVLLQFSAGVKIVPIDTPPMQGILAETGLADLFLRAVERGSQVNTDLSDGWDFWQWLDKPLEDVRHQLNILPLSIAPSSH
ncbi:MAG: hypothetical protein KME16_25920 [Scytolyngbya sp. HA4215-MV1]|nr:hypothetical protein [Scytolyngbya sp. HA4215-MV1]